MSFKSPSALAAVGSLQRVKQYPREYARLVRDALVRAMPWIDKHITEQPESGDFTTELRIEIPSASLFVPTPYVVLTSHSQDTSHPPMTDLIWWEHWEQDLLLTEEDPSAHLELLVRLVSMFMDEESAAYNAWLQGALTSGGTLVPPDAEPFPPGLADTISVRSWKGTFDRELTGTWPGWPNDPNDPFYKTL